MKKSNRKGPYRPRIEQAAFERMKLAISNPARAPYGRKSEPPPDALGQALHREHARIGSSVYSVAAAEAYPPASLGTACPAFIQSAYSTGLVDASPVHTSMNSDD